MGESERRRALRVPVRGIAVVQTVAGPLHGTIENVSQGGALIGLATRPSDELDVELRLGEAAGFVRARVIRTAPATPAWRVAFEFERVDEELRIAIDAAIASAVAASRRRPILIVDELGPRRRELIDRLAARGMTPLAPRTPLDTIELLTRAQLHVTVCMLAPASDLGAILADSFPWVTATAIDDDVVRSVDRAVDAWAATPVARLAPAIA